MHLRAITLNGFKTFARRTEIRFDGGMVAIVGPNGSGKSNIVDAFKWVLGETQAKDIRGRTMEEVIYAGGERRSRAAYAEVTMVFENIVAAGPLVQSGKLRALAVTSSKRAARPTSAPPRESNG